MKVLKIILTLRLQEYHCIWFQININLVWQSFGWISLGLLTPVFFVKEVLGESSMQRGEFSPMS